MYITYFIFHDNSG